MEGLDVLVVHEEGRSGDPATMPVSAPAGRRLDFHAYIPHPNGINRIDNNNPRTAILKI